ncbi:MAG: hypothetical protein FWF92_11315 [Oscillospiraceae bacterium]|nr:hypothetical protein [Oscillospiraceae bacterium]
MKKSKDSKNPENIEKMNNPQDFEKSKIKPNKSFKSVIGENNKFTKVISVLSLILIMFGLFAFIIIGLYRFDLIEIPQFMQNLFFKPAGDDSESEKDDRNIYEFMRENAKINDDYNDYDYNEGYSLEITRDNIKDIITSTKLPDNLYLETEANYYIDGKISRTEEMSLWKKGDKYKYILSVNSTPEESYINDTENEYIENFITGRGKKAAAVISFSFDNIPHVQNINYYLNLLENGEILSFYINQNSDSNIVRVKYYIPQLNQRELIDISLDTGIVLYVECTVGNGNDLFYKLETSVKEAYYDGDEQAKEKTSIQDSLFVIKN